MKFAYFPGCKIPYYLPQYDHSTRAVLSSLEVELVDMEFNCCGYPVRHQSLDAFIFSAARVMALARGYAILTPCMCCFGTLRHAEYRLKKSKVLREEVNDLLSAEGLQWNPEVKVKHLLSVLAEDVGLDFIRSKIRHRHEGLRVAAHYGCHGLRPGEIVQFDNPLAPTIFESLLAVTGAKCVDWPKRLSCCGNPLWEKNRKLSLTLMHGKIKDATACGAEILCTACTYCQIQFDSIRSDSAEGNQLKEELPAVLYTQLLGLSLGLESPVLGLEKNRTKWFNHTACKGDEPNVID